MDDMNRQIEVASSSGPGEETAVEAETEEGLSTWAKVGVGAGVAAGTGLAAWGLYKLGERYGWWDDPSPIIIDENDSKPDSGGGEGSKDTSGGGGSTDTTRRDRALGNPPNMSGDPEGYNTELFSSPTPVRVALNKLTYNVTMTGGTLVPNGQANAEVQRFQSDYNKVIHAIDAGKLRLPIAAPQPGKLRNLRGVLTVDGIPGKNTLNALEIALANQNFNKLNWREQVKKARS